MAVHGNYQNRSGNDFQSMLTGNNVNKLHLFTLVSLVLRTDTKRLSPI